MAVIRLNFIKKGRNERAAAKAHIRYIQNRPGRTQGVLSMTHSSHSHCCELAEMSNPEQLWYMKTYHDLDCKVYSPEYWLQYYTGGGWPSASKTEKKASQIDKLAKNGAASAARNGTLPGRGKDGARISRTLFGPGGQIDRKGAYEMIDQAEAGSTFFRVKICPDPNKEDMERDLLLREITEKTMALEEQIGKPVTWVASIHDDHTDKRHVHVLAVTKARFLPAQAMIHTASEACLEQRRELDLVREQKRTQEREGDEWERER